MQVESQELLAWLTQQGGFNEKVRIENFDHAGETVRGIGAAEAIPKGTGREEPSPPAIACFVVAHALVVLALVVLVSRALRAS